MHRSIPKIVSTTIAPILLAILALGSSATPAFADDPPLRRPLHDVGHGVSLLAQDAWALVTGPTRWTRDDLVELGGILAVGGVLFAFDPEIERFAQRNENEPVFDDSRRLGDQFGKLGLMGKTWPYYGGAMVLGYATNQRKIMRMGAQILEAQYLSGALRNAGKLVLGRRRPNEGKGAYYFEFNGGTSFPSGHAASVWSFAEVTALHVDRWWATAALYTIATSVSLQRLYGSAHWASDVWIGAVSGIAAGRFVYGRHESDAPRTARVVPLVAPDGRPALGIVREF